MSEELPTINYANAEAPDPRPVVLLLLAATVMPVTNGINFFWQFSSPGSAQMLFDPAFHHLAWTAALQLVGELVVVGTAVMNLRRPRIALLQAT